MGHYDTRVYTTGSGEIGELATAFNEMTQRQQALITSLSERQSELRTVMNAMSEGLLVISRDGDILHHNQAALSIFADLKAGGKKYWEVCRNADIYSHIQEGFDKPGLTSREVTVADQAFRINAIPIETENRLVITFHNITEFRRLERIKKDFIANISHEIKTPLTTIHGFVETLEEQLEGEPLRYLGIIKRNSERLTNLVKDLLLLSKLEEGGLSGKQEPVDLKALIDGVLPVYEPVAAQKGLTLHHTFPQESVTVTGDSGRLEDLLINLLDNAVKYTETGSVSLDLSLEDQQAVIEISDTGIGISPEHQSRVFERFYVVDPSRSKLSGGTGLGLAIVKHIVAQHRGTLSMESKPGQGTLFVVKLPLG
jgi:two-component system phosphate regulon sensor histidine kinase PhoR